MNKFTFQTIRAGFVLSFGLFLTASTVFASATILSTQTTDITDTSAVLNSQFDNPGMNSYVHFEWGYGSSFPSNTAGTQSFSVGSTFKTTLEGLTPDTTYSYRAVVVARPVTGGSALPPVYSPVVYFKTLPLKSTVSNTSSQTTNGTTQNNTNNQTNTKSTTSNTSTSVTKNSNSNSNSNNTTNTNKSSQGFTNTQDGFTNNSGAGASVIGSGANILPTTLTGWVILLIALFILLLIVRLLYEQSEKRKKALAAKKAAEAALAEAKKNQLATA